MELPSVSSAALTRQVAAEVTRQQSSRADMREKAAQAGATIAATDAQYGGFCFGNGSASREQLLRRLDLSISDLKQYIAANAPEIEQEEKNRQVQQSVDRTRKEKVETDEKVAALVKEFNKLLDEQAISGSTNNREASHGA